MNSWKYRKGLLRSYRSREEFFITALSIAKTGGPHPSKVMRKEILSLPLTFLKIIFPRMKV